jgi:hypothetical protein
LNHFNFKIYQELYVRHIDGGPASSDGERQRIVLCLEAAIRRRYPEVCLMMVPLGPTQKKRKKRKK